MLREYPIFSSTERNNTIRADSGDPGADDTVAKCVGQAGELASAAVRAERAAGKDGLH